MDTYTGPALFHYRNLFRLFICGPLKNFGEFGSFSGQGHRKIFWEYAIGPGYTLEKGCKFFLISPERYRAFQTISRL